MRIPLLHSLQLSPAEAIRLQKDLASQVSLSSDRLGSIALVCGVDVSYQKRAGLFHAAVVVCEIESMVIIETATASGKVDFPYVPGLLSFRELPMLLEAFRKLLARPDLILVDGQGIAHPRRIGFASHLGLWLQLPTIGCAKSRLCGSYEMPQEKRGSWTSLSLDGEEVGRVLRTRDRVKPLFVSPGHKIDCQTSVEVVLRCGRGYRLPEPTRLAHMISNQVRQHYETGSGF